MSEKRTELGWWYKDSEEVRSVIRETQWSLEDGSGVRVPVENGQAAGGGFMEAVGAWAALAAGLPLLLHWSQMMDSFRASGRSATTGPGQDAVELRALQPA